ncbi:hypothetical protein FCR2A7T_19310 [Flavobacterium cauense R2A-7]|uniref:Uncharacterized protein n=1 Tax=Flavobacterium cauense R2A-7 TaxID=1341154 RepID=V6RXV3_9FLAO|nr:hypothetical protein [Flavobacterium cauense]ESU19321.1 hypothetical protein FCR2A7T_19310 [Flavobacterium cauense R2A-7]KGO80287.1 hypothetical protein Q762_11660 [Flavobacterium cauense R2A-7]TWI09289.1 hypothetical protein IP98_02450 [Flavobacterium cauense R2A-7]
MKTIATLFAVFLVLLLLASCSNDDMQPPQPPLPNVVLENTATDAMMQRDSISKEEDIDPPKLPTPPIKT